MSIRTGILILLAAVMVPATVHAGWFAWLYGRMETHQVAAIPATPAVDFYGLMVAGIVLVGIAAQGRK